MNFAAVIKIGICCLIMVAAPFSFAMEIYAGENEDGDGYSYLIAEGAMLTKNEADKIRRFLDRQAVKGNATAIFLNSEGGYAELMPQFAKAFLLPSHELYRRHGLFNTLVVNQECSSACVILMGHITNRRETQALRMYISAHAQFGMHSPVEIVDGKFAAYRDPLERETRISAQLKMLLDAGVTPGWLEANVAIFRNPEMTFAKAADLCKSNSRIIPPGSCVTGVADLAVTSRAAILLAIGIKRGKVVAAQTDPAPAIAAAPVQVQNSAAIDVAPVPAAPTASTEPVPLTGDVAPTPPEAIMAPPVSAPPIQITPPPAAKVTAKSQAKKRAPPAPAPVAKPSGVRPFSLY